MATVIEVIHCKDRIWINTCCNKTNDETALYVKPCAKARTVHTGDKLWWQGTWALWTPWNTRINKPVGPTDVQLDRIGGTGAKRPTQEQIVA